MAVISKQGAPRHESMPGFEGHYSEVDGYLIGFESYDEYNDAAELFLGLPDDRCQSRHWVYVIRGRVGFRYADREEVIEAGEAYYAPSGHTPVFYPDTEVVEFSPAEEIEETIRVVLKNVEAMQG